ncbi:hypothetical protein BKA64DRAFT_773072 [Cadophora sp. MPI-SDFR-AT-0126]|nr:hypothetical protein BKA64DRAFT_773072 [Leotiomycetes sp. MPI-SDFR-AT-0126]
MALIVAVIGASRGIGKELVKQLSESGEIQVIASTRSPQTKPTGPSEKSITLDMTDDASVKAAAETVPELDTLIINAAMGNNDTLLDTSPEELALYMNTNVVDRIESSRPFCRHYLLATQGKSSSFLPRQDPTSCNAILEWVSMVHSRYRMPL